MALNMSANCQMITERWCFHSTTAHSDSDCANAAWVHRHIMRLCTHAGLSYNISLFPKCVLYHEFAAGFDANVSSIRAITFLKTSMTNAARINGAVMVRHIVV